MDRWIWCLAKGESHGLDRRIRRRLRRVWEALVADGRYLEATRVILDTAWIDAYRGRHQPKREQWIDQAGDLLRLGRKARVDEDVLAHWQQACTAGWVSSELAERVFLGVRGLPQGVRCKAISLA